MKVWFYYRFKSFNRFVCRGDGFGWARLCVRVDGEHIYRWYRCVWNSELNQWDTDKEADPKEVEKLEAIVLP